VQEIGKKCGSALGKVKEIDAYVLMDLAVGQEGNYDVA
jgi:hypothetical protein